QRVLDFSSLVLCNLRVVDLREDADCLSATAHLHQPTRAFDSGVNHAAEQKRRYDAGEKHPSPASRGVPGLIAHTLDKHVHANGAESETFLFTEIIRHGSGSSAADDAPDEGAPGGPSCACRVKMKELAQIANGAADHNVVVTEEQATQSRDAGRNEEWGARMGLDE